MDNTTAQRIAKRFVGLPEEQRRQILQKMAETGQSFRLLPIVPTRHDVEQIPLSYAQQRLMFLWQLEPTSSFYNVPMAVRLTGVLDEAAMGRAFGQLFDRHESLRTRFVSLEGVFYQQIEASGNFEFPIHPVQTEAQLEIEVGRVLSEPFDLLDGPLFRARLLSVSPTEHVLAVCMHHIVSDGWSMELMVGEFVRLYEAQCQGVDAQLPELTVQYADYAIWQRAWLEAGEGQRQLAYWQAQLGDEHPLLALPLDRPRPAVATFKGALVPVKLDAQNTAALRAHGRKHGHTMFMTVLAAMAVVLSRFSGQRDIRIGAPNAGRNRQELEGLIGFFINTQVLRVDVDELATPAQLLEQVKDVVAQAQSHQDIPFEQLVDALVPERSLGHNPLFQFKLNQNLSIERAERGVRQNMGGLSIEEYGLARADARFDLAFDFADDERGLEGFFTYATDLFDAALIERMAQAFTQLLGSMANYPHVPLIEQRVDSSACLVGPPLSAPVQDVLGLWRAQVLAQPGRIAVRDAQGELGALTLERESNRLARYLRAQGVGAGDRVALCQNRSGEWVCSLLAVLKSGAAFLPLDPEQPRERLQQLLDDSAAVACIYSSNDPLSTLLNTRVPVLYEPARWAAFEDTPLDLRIVPQSAAYVIYTSGSTGTPKGVVVSHGALAHYTQTALERLALAPDASLAMVSSVAADLGHTVLFGALAGGKTLHLLSREAVFDPDGFAAYMHEQRISVLKIVPSHLQGLLQATQPARVLPAHLLILGGEPCPAVLVEQVRSLKPDCRVVNHYGPTETTVGVLTHELSDEDLAHNIIAVGWPLGGTCVEVLDEYLCNVASGVWGELYIAGPSLADGYLGRPGLTAERFVPDARGDGLRSYRSGDRARVTSQGIAVAGRLDDQVKIRGYRVEPGEVGRCIQRFSGVTQAAVLALPVPGDAQRLQLVAYYVGGSHVSAEALRHYLSETLPDALIPAHFVALDRLPLTSNGKLDRRSLPKPQPQVRQQVAPTDEVQSILAGIWAQVLKLDSVGIADNFFELGGDSILSLQIIAKSKRQGIKITPKQLFEHQTIEALAHVAKRIEAKPAAAVRHSGQDEGTTLLLPAQRRFFEQEIADRHHWNQSILLVPGQPLEQASLAVALERLAQQHAALRLSFPQEAVEQGQAQFERKVPADVLWCCAVESAHEISALADEAQRSLNPARGHVFRAVLINLPDNTQRLLLVAHHLVVDGVSWRILLEDLQALLASGGAWEAGPAAHSLKAWAQALQQHAMQSAMQQELAYWLEQGSVHTGALPMDNPDGAATYRQVSTATSRLDAHLTQALLKVAPAAYRTQINDLLLCALARVLVQWSEQDCVLIELEGHGREDWFEDVDITRTVGWFTSVYPVRLTPEPLMGESIKAIKEQLRSVPNKGLGYGVLRYLGEPAQREQLKGLPAAGITFNYLGQFDGSFDHADTAFVPARESFGRTQSDDAPLSNGLAINGQIYAGQLSLEWTFSHDQYRPETIDALAKAYEQALTELIEHCCASGNLGVTPSDFPLAGLNQAQLDQLPVACDQIEDIYPLSPMQEGLLVHTLLEPGSGIYLMQYCYVIEHEINIALFSQAWGTVVRRHPVLRTSFCWEAGERMVQIVHRDARPDLRVLDWTGIDPDGYECRLALELEEELTIGFDLAHEVPFRLRLVKLGAEHFGFVFSNHHILLDAWCRMGIVAEFFTLYNDLLAGRASTLPTPSRYRDFIAWLEGQDRSQWETFWRNELSGFEQPTRLPFDRTPSREGQDSVIGDRMLCLDEAQTRQLQSTLQANQLTVNTLVQGAWALLLSRYSGEQDVVFGVTVAGRPVEFPEMHNTVGLFINSVPLRVRLPDVQVDMTVKAWLQALQQHNVTLREHEHLALVTIQSLSEVGKGQQLFESLFVFENAPVQDSVEQGASELNIKAGDSRTHTNYPITVVIYPGQVLGLHLSYDERFFDALTIEAMLDEFRRIVLALAGGLDQSFHGLQACTPVALESPRQDDRNLCDEPGYARRFRGTVERFAERVGARCMDRQWSYGQLDELSDHCAAALHHAGVVADEPVAILAPRDLPLLGMVVSTFKVGAGYLALDPALPLARQAQVMTHSATRWLICAQASLESAQALLGQMMAPRPQLLVWEQLLAQSQAPWSTAPVEGDMGKRLAYVIFTSGSTGVPKGVMVEQAGMLGNQLSKIPYFGLNEHDVIAQTASQSFDISVWQLLTAGLCGATVDIVPQVIAQDPEALLLHVARHRITLLESVPSLIQAFLELPPLELPSLRYLLTTGEAMAPALAARWLERYPDIVLVNAYGPAECSDDVALHRVVPEDCDALHLPVGLATDHNRLYVLNDRLEAIPRRATGELHVAGVGVGRGYLADPVRTALAFVPNPYGTAGGERLYRTGDRVRQRGADGVLEFIARTDHQVKIRGYRIEPGEIETRLRTHEGIQDCVVVDVEGPSGRQLAAYIVVRPEVWETATQVSVLREFLGQTLPEYMLPAYFVAVERLPLTPNGKLDRKALPKPEVHELLDRYVAPVTPLEHELAQILCSVLKVPRVGRHDNFFELGGDSIVAIQVVSRARKAGIQLSPKDLFQRQTVAALATVAKHGVSQCVDDKDASGRFGLTPIQRQFFEASIPERHFWNQSVMFQVQQPLDPVLLEKALCALVIQHPSLRTRYVREGEEWTSEYVSEAEQHRMWASDPVLWVERAGNASALRDHAQRAQRSLSLEQGPLLRGLLVDLEQGEQRLLLAIHHMVVDGVSWRILLDDLQSAYKCLADGVAPAWEHTSNSFKTWAEHLADYARSVALRQEQAYWTSHLQDAPRGLPYDNPNGSLQHKHARYVTCQLTEADTHQLLHQAPAAYRTQINDLLLTALARVVCRWTGNDRSLIKLEGHGREELFGAIDVSRTVGWFTTMYPVCLTPCADVGDSIKAIKEQLRAIPLKGLGYGVLKYLGDAATRQVLDELAEPLITFNYLGQFDQAFDDNSLLRPASEDIGGDMSEAAPMENALCINGQVYNGCLSLTWTYSDQCFEASTVQGLARALELELQAIVVHCGGGRCLAATPTDFPLAQVTQTQLDSLPIDFDTIEDLYALSPLQKGMFFHTADAQGSGQYVNHMRVDVQGLDIERFKMAWQGAIDNHEVLRASYLWSASAQEPLQVINRQATMAFFEYDGRDWDMPEAALDALCVDDRKRGFDLAQPPLMRLHAVRMGPDRHHLLYSFHHILLDGWSNFQLLGEVLQRYAGATVAAPVTRYRDYIHWLTERSSHKSEAFWRASVASLSEVTRLTHSLKGEPADSSLSDVPGRLRHALSAEQTRRLVVFCREQRVTVNTLVQAAWLILLSRYTGNATVALGATVAGRPTDLVGAEQQMGNFINTIAVVSEVVAQQQVGPWLQALQQWNLESREHEHTPLYHTQRWAGSRGESLFDTLLVFENYPVAEALEQSGGSGLTFSNVRNEARDNYPIALLVALEQCLEVSLLHDRALVSAEASAQVMGHFVQLLDELCVDAQRPLGELQMLTPAERAARCAVWQHQGLTHPSDRSVHRLFEARVAQQPQARALIFGERSLSYDVLNRQANRLAHRLMSMGVKPEVRVAIAMQRSAELMVSFLAVLKAGGAYVPLDIEYPEDRLAFMMNDSQAALLITQTALLDRMVIDPALDVLLFDDADAFANFPEYNPQVEIAERNLAYVIYTSGSTGLPKGVAVEHGPLATHSLATGERYEMTPADCELHYMSFAFDGAHEGWMHPLISGASVLIRDDELWTPEQTYQQMHRHGVTVGVFPPIYLQQLAEHVQRVGNRPAVRVYCFGGDAVSQASYNLAREVLDPEYIFNGYGPTETVVTPLIWKAGRDDNCGAAYAPIGELVGSRSGFILDTDLGLLPTGVCGELYLGGHGVARGYLGRPGLTAERFVPDPFTTDGSRLYRSGDLTRYRSDDLVEYLGRVDYQVKVRGFRIELGEIEARLLDQPDVREAVVVARDVAGSKQLAAYLVMDPEKASVPEDSLRDALSQALQRVLPAYMMPSWYVFLERLPLTPNGKLDRRGLPEPSATNSSHAYQAPKNEAQRQLVSVWEQVLQISPIGVTDNFFECGGDSMLGMRVVSLINALDIPGVSPRMADLLQRPTIVQLLDTGGTCTNLLPMNRAVSQGAPLFCIHGGYGTVFDYEHLARRLDGKRRVIGVQSGMLFDPARREVSLAAMARQYVAQIRSYQAEGPYALLGWSLGGALAMLMTYELEAQGQEVQFLGIVDGFVPDPVFASAPDDWEQDLKRFVQLVAPDAVYGPLTEQSYSEETVLAQLKKCLDSSVDGVPRSDYLGLTVEELTNVFRVMLELKSLARQQGPYPRLKAHAACWWIEGRELERAAFVAQTAPCRQDSVVRDVDHYSILQSEQFYRDVQALI